MPYEASKAHDFTRKANTGSRSRQWKAVYESSIARGDDEGVAITKASGVTKKNWKKTNPKRRKPVDHRPAHMKTGATSPLFIGFAKQALRHTARARTKQYISSKKVPTVKAHELADFKSLMVSDARRMSIENGKGAIVSRSKLMKKHTRRGGRFADMQDSVSKSRTFRAQPISQEGQRVVTFSDAAKKPKAKTKKPKR